MRLVWIVTAVSLIIVALYLSLSGVENRSRDGIAPALTADKQEPTQRAPTTVAEVPVEDEEMLQAETDFGDSESIAIVVPALPGVPGLSVPTVPLPQGGRGSPALLLEQEPEDQVWASQMRGQILDAIADLVAGANQIEVVCKTTRCGVFVASDEEEAVDSLAQYLLEERLKSELGLSRCMSMRGGMNTTPSVHSLALYFQQRDRQGCSLTL